MRIGHLARTIISCYENPNTRKHALLLLGSAGIGKSQVCAQVAEYFRSQLDPNFGFVDVRLSQLDPVDMRGVPYIVDGQTRWATPCFLPDCEKVPNGILFLDEINAAPPSVAAAGYQLILDRALGEYKLGEGWIILAAGNEQSDRGVTFTMPAPLTNRFIPIKVTTHLDDVMDRAAVVGVDPVVMAFLKARADYLHKFDGKAYVSGEQFPTPRGWFKVSDILSLQLDNKQRDELIHGSVGKEAGHDFVTFLKLRDSVVSFEEILNDPEGAEVPAELNRRYMVTMTLAARMDKFNADTVYKYLRRLPRELQVMAVTLAYRRSREITRTKMFEEYSKEIADVLRKTAN
jgi:hypothetical protein